jgi:NADH-quinone oxidoreductase subunit I
VRRTRLRSQLFIFKMSAVGNYFKEIFEVVQSTRKGMALTWKHAWNARKQRTVHQIQDAGYFQQSEGIVTLEYPSLQIPTPVNGRYQLHNEMDDCIVCDKCVKVCPVDCIDIEPIKATGLVGHASDGSPIRLYAAKFDIDMSKCCFCGLCTTVCPTECLTMTSEYDFSVFDVKEHNFSFANLTSEEAEEKRKLYEQFVAEKAAMKAVASQESLVASPESGSPRSEGGSPEAGSPESEGQTSNVQSPTSKPKPAFKPSFKKVTSQESLVASPEGNSPKSEGQTSNIQSPKSDSLPTKPKPAFKPSFKKVASQESLVASPKAVVSSQSSVVSGQESDSPEAVDLTSNVQSPTSDSLPSKPKPAFKPSFKKVASQESLVASPKAVVSSQSSVVSGQESDSPEAVDLTSNVQSPTSDSLPSKPKPAFKPSYKKASPKSEGLTSNDQSLTSNSPTSNSPTSNPDLP